MLLPTMSPVPIAVATVVGIIVAMAIMPVAVSEAEPEINRRVDYHGGCLITRRSIISRGRGVHRRGRAIYRRGAANDYAR